MKNIIKRIICLLTLTSILSTTLLTGCTPVVSETYPHKDATLWEPKEENKDPNGDVTENAPVKVGVFDADDMIHQDGELLKTAAGEIIHLRGVNVGGLFVMENWMQKIFQYNILDDGSTTAMYDKQISEIFLERFGREKTEALWQEFRDNWFSDEDFKICKELGINVIRLPITYMTVDFDAVIDYNLAAYEYDFSLVDEFIEKAASYGIYTILDLHGAYGSQNVARKLRRFLCLAL